MEDVVIDNGAVPATIFIEAGEIFVGSEGTQLEFLGKSNDVIKVSRKDFAGAILKKKDGGTTVSGTMTIASLVGIRVFATGGIGGVHRNSQFDVSADLPSLASISMIVVCSGAKAILDLPATKEYLETYGVPVLGYQVDEIPAFYSRNSGLKVDFRCDHPSDVVNFALTHWSLGIQSSVLLVVPPPAEIAINNDYIEKNIESALASAQVENITGPQITPYLLSKLSELTHNQSMATNIALLKNNAEIAAKIAVSLSQTQR